MLKYLALFLISFNCLAKDFEFTYSLVNTHVFARSSLFKNKIDNNGILLNNKFMTLRYKKIGLIYGEDSAGDKVLGSFFRDKLKWPNWYYIIGFYTHSERHWNNVGLYNHIGSFFNFNPVIGAQYQYKISKSLNTNLILTPSIIQVNIGWEF